MNAPSPKGCDGDRGYEPGRENHEFDPSLGNFFLAK